MLERDGLVLALTNLPDPALNAVAGRVTAQALAVALAGVPGVIAGPLAGERGFRKLDRATFRRVVFAMLLASGVVSLITALVP